MIETHEIKRKLIEVVIDLPMLTVSNRQNSGDQKPDLKRMDTIIAIFEGPQKISRFKPNGC